MGAQHATTGRGALTAGPARTARHRPYWRVGLAGLFAGLLAGWLLATSSHLVYAMPYAVLVSLDVWIAVGIGLYYWNYQPASPVGNLLIAYGFANALIGLQGSSQPLISSLGVLAEVPALMLILGLVLLYRRHVLDATGRLVLGLWAFLVVLLYLPWLLFHPTVVAPTALGACQAHCPPNPLFISRVAGLITPLWPTLVPAWRICAFILLGGVFLSYVPTLRRSAAERQVMIPVLIFFSGWVVASTLYGAAQLTGLPSLIVFWVLYHTRLLFPFSFLFGLLAIESLSTSALKTVLKDLDAGAEATTLTHALRDPAITLAFWVPQTQQFMDADGRPVVPPPRNSGHVLTELRRGNELIGAIVSDPALAQHPDLLEAAARAVTLTANNRRRIERDLHDSVQQQLLAVEMRLELVLGLTRDDGLRERLSAMRNDLENALQNLRDITRGQGPARLLVSGLGPALADVAERAPITVEVRSGGVGRYRPEIEEAIYFCCLEALQNAEKHGGQTSQVTIDLKGTSDTIRFAVADGGPGFDPSQPTTGQGLVNMTERMQAIGGWLSVESAVGGGTTVSGGVSVQHDASSGHDGEP